MTEKTIAIQIIDATQRKGLKQRTISQLAFVCMFYGPGLIFESAAMQWAGFVFTLVIAVGVIADIAIQATPMTAEEARAKIDKIEGRQAAMKGGDNG